MPAPFSTDSIRSSSSKALRPGPADVARHLSLVVHDLRGPTTALQAFARFLDEQARPLDPGAASWLDACQANAEVASHLCDALSILEGTCLRSQASLASCVTGAVARLQKLLARGRISLKFPGEFPDRDFERRRFSLAVESILIAAAQAGMGHSTLELRVVDRGDRVVLTMTSEREVGAALEAMALRLRKARPAGLSEMAMRASLTDLEGRVVAGLRDGIGISLPARESWGRA